MQALKIMHRWWAAVIFLGVIVQIGLAGYAAFNAVNKAEDARVISKHTVENGWDPHTGFGYAIFLGAIVLFLLALGARPGRRWVFMNLGLVVLVIVQILFAYLGGATSALGFLHAINAFLVLGLSGRIAFEAWWGTRRPTAPVPT